MRRLIAFFTLTLYFTGSALAGIVTGNVTGILDGDTLEVLHNRHPERLRLSGIDRPEKGQAYGKEVTIQVLRKDRHGRTVGDVVLTDGTNVSRKLVKAELAWWYRQYSKDASLGVLYEDARQAKRGLRADQNPNPLWEVRQPNQGRTPLARGDLSSDPVENLDTTPMPIIGNRNSHIYHRPTALAIQPPRLRIA